MDQDTDVSAVSGTMAQDTPMNGHDVSADTFIRALNGHDISANSSYLPFPSSGPVNDDCSTATKPVMSFVESERNGVLSALQSLQEKMRRLEVERRAAESSLQTLASETQLYKSSLHQPLFLPHPNSTPGQEEEGEEEEEEREEEEEEKKKNTTVEPCSNGHLPPKQLESQLSSAESRCQLLEKQLDYMRQLVPTTDKHRSQTAQKAAEMLQRQRHQDQLQQQKQQQQQQHQRQKPSQQELYEAPSPLNPDYVHSQMERIDELERDHVRLTASQTLAESRIKELEAKLRLEREHRTLSSEKTTEPMEKGVVHPSQGVFHPPGNIRPPPPPSNGQRKKRGSSSNGSNKKKKKKAVSRKTGPPVKTEPSQHYRLNLADIPFVAGKSTAPSHAVGANIQKVLAMMKSHNMALCSSSSSSPLPNGHTHTHTPHTHTHGGCNGGSGETPPAGVGRLRSSNSPRSSLPADLDLADLLVQLQDEFGQLSLEHQEYLQMLQEATDSHIQQDLQRELNNLMVRMELKSQQIAKVRQHQHKLEDVRRSAKRRTKKPEPVTRPTSAQGRLQSSPRCPNPQLHSGNLRPGKSSSASTRKESDSKPKELTPPSLNVLRDMRKLQTTLRRDDLCWE